MTFPETITLVAYFFVLIILAVYGWHRYYLVYLYVRHREAEPKAGPALSPLPRVTIQLPLYNEMYVAERLIEAVSRIAYPRELLQIQVLDDSTDETRKIAELAIRRLAADGRDVQYLHRTNRAGYKAGALEAGLRRASGEFIAIFDADFLPTEDFLARLMPHFADPKVGMVQARWGHINQNYSLLTRIQSILLDGHFVLEHGGRNRAGRFFNFNGTAGIWRRTAIDDAGGWQHDTLTEDLDLSYRAQLRGWRFVFAPDVVAPAEVPVEMNAFKSQQHRWAKGSIQTFLKLMPRILQSDQPFHIKAEAFFHLSANFNYPLMCVLSVLMAPSMVIRYNMGWYEMLLIDVPLFLAATASVHAHHSFSATYDGNKPVTLRGTVSRLGWSNPHAHIYVDVKNQQTGQMITWEVESAGASNLLRQGLRKEDFIGAEVIIKGFLAKDGTPTVNASSFTLVAAKKEFVSDEAAPTP